jgi:predicted component of type VI protein secretion system
MVSISLFFGDKHIADYPFDKPALVVGRDESSDIRIDNLGISRAHCQFIKRGNTFLLQDMNSANGTYVSGKRVGEHYLNDNDEVFIGKFKLIFRNPEQQAEAKKAARADVVPDSLNTYVMDGAAIREKLAQMGTAPEAPKPAPNVSPGAAPVSAAAYAARMGAAARSEAAPAPAAPAAPAVAPAVRAPARQQAVSPVFILSILLNIVLAGVLIYLFASGRVRVGPEIENIPPPPPIETPADTEGAGGAAEATTP